MKASELRQKSEAALQDELNALSKEIFNLRLQRASGQMARPHLMRNARRNIARVKTVLNEKRTGKAS